VVVEGGEVELAHALGVGERVDGGDLACGDGEAHDRDRLAVDGDHDAGGAVDQDGVGAAGGPGEHERLPCHGRRAADDRRGSRLGAAVGSQHDVGGEGGGEGGGVGPPGGSAEGGDDPPLAGGGGGRPA